MKLGIISTALLCATTVLAQAAEFDIAGMKLGMNADQIVARYQELRPEGQYSFSNWKLPEGSEWIANGRALYNDLANPNDMEHERMQFAFTGLGSGNGLFAIQRDLKFRPSQRPSTDSIYAAAVKKYGEPSDISKSDTVVWAAWKFNSIDDASAEKIGSLPGCLGGSDFPVGLDDHMAQKARKYAEHCGLYIEITVRGGETGLANEIQMGMINYLDLLHDFDADNEDARRKIDAAKAKNASDAAPVPEL